MFSSQVELEWSLWHEALRKGYHGPQANRFFSPLFWSFFFPKGYQWPQAKRCFPPYKILFPKVEILAGSAEERLPRTSDKHCFFFDRVFFLVEFFFGANIWERLPMDLRIRIPRRRSPSRSRSWAVTVLRKLVTLTAHELVILTPKSIRYPSPCSPRLYIYVMCVYIYR